MNGRWWACLAACLLAGCAGAARYAGGGQVYDFGLAKQGEADAARWVRIALEVKAPPWSDSPAIVYRLLYDDPLKLRSYVDSRWAAAPPLLLAQRWRQQLGFAGASGQTAAACLLRFELQEFSHVFDTPQHSRGVLHGRLALLDAGRRTIAERAFAEERPAASADARGGVGALLVAGDELGRQLAEWLNDLERQGAAGDCRATAARSR
ncbi:MAG TPA: ABC-type transport auxiliary lipoprotein family protein [Accumulibacter sp.]|uniref:ABC-type transport auxiliary lipoprotein family protein n=2 Tax=Accumulibacter sp. TaxID=2053492 RepID=UPI00287B0B69|nr:ABC-type transport auxiliary lipoprotein family protein [Accumulibacter sp.]MDS4054515.1 ABC-type transport auxiliary lipoprotein family protein [Accumulibacter sp.]HMW63594.1 ABC-type transport auxiliary lipoprotein family protein [Accumulibacter sp.]HNB68718.1 ABC-type transport auxiliary lipoprotein family protein [Accumulibacter sp.]HNC25389.1 ABC-type transport auxiliary lipoprotein family protein [Accumulibacter sp.]HND38664.1 ABC-type transport auxiliary lipoprotein family protein [A